jgi:hypothetical protein
MFAAHDVPPNPLGCSPQLQGLPDTLQVSSFHEQGFFAALTPCRPPRPLGQSGEGVFGLLLLTT